MRSIRCYISPPPASRNKIADWYNDLSAQERADADEFIKNIRKLREWSWHEYRHLGEGLGELRWESEKKQQRLIGFFSGETWYAVIGCTHKQNIYKPPDALDTAKKRKKQIERGEVETTKYDL